MRKEMGALEALFTRRSVRFFSEKPIAAEDIETIVRAGMYAPSASNRRTWEILTIADKARLKELAALCRHWGPLANAQLGIVCCSHVDADKPEDYRTFLEQNGAAATENMLLCAHALGLGGVWLNASPKREHYEPVKALLGIPEGTLMVSVLAIGHPADDLPPRAEPAERFEPAKWHKESW